jgi:hypothetical protein
VTPALRRLSLSLVVNYRAWRRLSLNLVMDSRGCSCIWWWIPEAVPVPGGGLLLLKRLFLFLAVDFSLWRRLYLYLVVDSRAWRRLSLYRWLAVS